jgi:hypothetical protein
VNNRCLAHAGNDGFSRNARKYMAVSSRLT